jgi:hypothetical protein
MNHANEALRLIDSVLEQEEPQLRALQLILPQLAEVIPIADLSNSVEVA